MKIAFLLYDQITALDVIGPYEVFNALPGAELLFVAKRAGPIPVDSGAFSIVAPYAFADVASADVLVVPGSSSGTVGAMADAEIIAWVQRIHETTRWTTSVCSGALILAQAGVLRDRRATTHWAAMPFLGHLGAHARPDERVVKDGKLVTAAGVSAGLDMALYLVGEIAGPARAEAAQLMIEYDPQPPYSSGHTSKASEAVRKMAADDMRRTSITARATWAVARLAGQRFMHRARATFGFSM